MESSVRYKELKREIERLRKDLLPKRFRRKGQYGREEVTKTLAYRVLVHAEIEGYLEDRAWEIALKAVKLWKEKNKVSKTILALLGFCGRIMDKPPESQKPEQMSQLSQWDEKIKISKKIDLAVNDFHSVVERNHGIKEASILSLLLPIGIDCDELDTVLVADLNSYGESRGLVAHKSGQAYRMKQQTDPKEELRKVGTLVKDLLSIESALNSLVTELEN